MASGWVAYGPAIDTGGATPPEQLRPELADVGRLLRRGVRAVVGAARADERVTLSRILVEFLGDGAPSLEVVQESWPGYEHVNVQAGLDAWLAEPGRTSELVGIVGYQHRPFGLGELLTAVEGAAQDPFGPRPGNPSRVNRACGPDGEVRPCVRCGLYLVTEGEFRIAVFFRGPEPETGVPFTALHIAASDPEVAQRAAAEIRDEALARNVFRGQVLSFGGEVFGHHHGETVLTFHPRPTMTAEHLVLDPGTLAEVQRQVVEVARHKERLLAAGQHLKRGLLLFGPPGVGKTHTVRFLVSQLTGTTVMQLTANALHLIVQAPSRGSHRACEV